MSEQGMFEDEQEKIAFKDSIEKRNQICRKVYQEGKQVNGCVVDYDSAFGINNQDINGQLQIVGKEQIVYVAGNIIVIKDLSKKTYQFISNQDMYKNVTCLYAQQKKNEPNEKQNGGNQKGNKYDNQQIISNKNQGQNIAAAGLNGENAPIVIATGESTGPDNKNCSIIVTTNQKTKWYQISQNVKGVVKQIQLNIEKKYCCALVQPQGSQNCIINFWQYSQERLIATLNLKSNVPHNYFKFSMHPVKHSNIVITGNNYLKMQEVVFQEKVFKESHQPLVPLKTEKENKFLDQVWTTNTFSQIPILVALAEGNRILILQNDQLKKQIDIDVTNLNIVEAMVQDINFNENELDDMYDGIHNVIDDMMRDKGGKDMFQNEKDQPQKKLLNTSLLKFNCLSAKQNGFVLGSNKGVLCIYDVEKNFQIVNKQSYEMKMSMGQDMTIFYVSSSILKDDLISIVSYDQNKIINYHILNMGDLDNEISPIQPFFSAGFHTKKINCIDSSITKQIFATCSEDQTVKIWNYYESDNQEKKGIISQYFKEEPLFLSLHPFGMFIAVTFGTFFKVFAILNEQLYALKTTSMSNCTILKYSNGGNYLAANEKNYIFIYDTIYYQVVRHLNDHSTLIRDFYITDDDIQLISTSIDGCVFIWNLVENQAPGSTTQTHQEFSIFNQIVYDIKALKDEPNYKDSKEKDDHCLFVGSTNEKYLVLFRKNCKTDDLIAEFPIKDCYVTQIIVSNQLKCLFLGTSNGKVRVSVWPLHEENLEYEQINPNSNQVRCKIPDYFEISVFQTAVTAMKLSNDNQYLMCGDENGIIQMLKISNYIIEGQVMDFKKQTNSNSKNDDKARIDQTSNDLFLAKISKIMQKNEQRQELSKQVVRLELDKKIEIQNIDSRYRQKVQQINTEFETQLKQDIQIKETFINKSNEEYNKLLKLYEQEEVKYTHDLENLKKQHQEKIEYEQQRNQELEQEIENIKQKHKDNLQQLLEDHKQELTKLKLSFYDKCQKIQVKYSNVVDSAKVYGNEFIKSLEQEEAANEEEIERKIKKLKEEISKVRKVNEELSSKKQDLEEEYKKKKLVDDELQKQFDALFKQHNEIRLENLKNDEHILKSQHQLLERLQVIDSKEETCKQAKDEQINLENFRYMLDQKIKSLQTEKQSLLEKINSKEKNLKNMFNELIKESNQNEEKYQSLKKLNAEIQVLENSIKKAEVEIFFNTNTLTSFQNQLASIMKSNESVTVIAKRLNDMLESKDSEGQDKFTSKKVVSNDDIQEIIKMKQEKPNEVNDELLKQGKWLTKKLYLIKETSSKLKLIRDDNINTILNQNTKLIEECNLLRGENERYRKEMKKIEKLLAEAIRKRTKLREKNKEFNQAGTSPSQMKKLIQKYDNNEDKLTKQQTQLSNIRESIEEILVKQNDGEQVRLPQIQNNYQYQQEDSQLQQSRSGIDEEEEQKDNENKSSADNFDNSQN